jgi:hypothetical protein
MLNINKDLIRKYCVLAINPQPSKPGTTRSVRGTGPTEGLFLWHGFLPAVEMTEDRYYEKV